MKMKMKKYLVLCAVVVFALSIPILAAGDAFNVRPVSPLGPSFGGEQSLQSVFDTYDPGLNAISGQQSAAIFVPNERIVETTFKLEITGAYPVPGEAFGIYSFADPTDMLTVLDGNEPVGSAFTITFDVGGVLGRVRSLDQDTLDQHILDNFSGYSFGFWLYTPDQGGQYFYSEDSRNPGGLAQMLVFKSIATYGDWWLCWEDLQRSIGGGHSDSDFQDILIKAESMTPVPEPATMLLLGSGLIGLAGYARRRFKK